MRFLSSARLLIAGHEQERGALKDELQLRLATARTETGRADAYSRFADDLQRSAGQFQASSRELDAKEKALADCE